MRVIPSPELARGLIDTLARGDHGTPRTSGVHQSGIIQALLQAMDPNRYANPVTEQAKSVYFAAGFAFEQVVEGALLTALEDRIAENLMAAMEVERPGEIASEGILQSPDGLEFDTETVHEFKLTWMSSREGIAGPGAKKWLWQIQGYLHTLGWTKAILWVLWVNGGYAPPVPQFMAYQLEFTPFEIAENWAMLLANKSEAAEEVHGNA